MLDVGMLSLLPTTVPEELENSSFCLSQCFARFSLGPFLMGDANLLFPITYTHAYKYSQQSNTIARIIIASRLVTTDPADYTCTSNNDCVCVHVFFYRVRALQHYTY